MSEATITAAVTCRLVEFAEDRGASRQELLERSRLTESEIADRAKRVPFAKYVALMRAAKELCHDTALALHFGEEVDLGELSIVGMTGGTSESLENVFSRLNRHVLLDIDFGTSGDRFGLAETDGETWVIDGRPNPNEFPEFTESFFARAVAGMRRWLGDAPFVTAIEVTHSEPSYRAEYDRIFGVPVTFGADRNALRVSPAFWNAFRQRFPPTYATEILRAHADALVEKLTSSKTTRGRVESLLAPMLRTGEASMKAIAGMLGLSRQTLFRKLKAEGTTFERVLDELRHELALRNLDDKRISVNETSYLLGFSDPAAFSRAFKRWTGTSPAAWRDRCSVRE